MQTTERQRLISTMTVEPAHAVAAALKCGVCLALLTLLLVIGSTSKYDATASEARRSAPAAAAARLPSAAAHRKAVFDDRRARFAGNASERTLAGRAQDAPAEAYAP